MKILLVSETLHVGGAETFVVRMANALVEVGHDVALAVFFDTIVNEALLAQLDKSVRVTLIHTPALRLLQKLDGGFRRLGIDFTRVYSHIGTELLKIVDGFAADVVHTHLFKTDWVVGSIRNKARKPFRHIITIHGDYSSFFHGEAASGLLHIPEKMRRTLAQSDAVVCLCEEHRRFFPQHYPTETAAKLHIVYNGYKPANEDFRAVTRTLLGLPGDAYIIGMVSRGVEKKGWARAADAFTAAAIPGAKLVFVGQGEFLDELKMRSTNPDIIFAGFSAMPVAYIQHFDLCLLPSLFSYESLPTVVIEYLYCGKPVIATDVGEIGAMITAPDGQLAGSLLAFDGLDISVPELRDSMLRAYESRIAAPLITERALAAFRKFDMTNCVTRYLELYREQ